MPVLLNVLFAGFRFFVSILLLSSARFWKHLLTKCDLFKKKKRRKALCILNVGLIFEPKKIVKDLVKVDFFVFT